MSTVLPTTPTPSATENDPASVTRIAIIGCGPRGMYCLETLSRAIKSAGPKQRFEITVYEPSDHPGAGNVYDPTQPKHLRMNFASRYVDAWRIHRDQRSTGPSLLDWIRSTGRATAEPDAFLPRAVVGEYLQFCFRRIWDSIARLASANIDKRRVDSIEPVSGRWIVICGNDRQVFDEVVVTVGHEGFRSGNLQADVDVFPVDANLNLDSIAPDSAIRIHGFGLTAIDATLTLTQGRGGIFDQRRPIPHYHRAGYEPKHIELVSRSGRPMLAKPSGRIEPIDQGFWEPFRERLQDVAPLHGAIRFRQDIWNVVTDAADALLHHYRGDEAAGSTSDWFRGWCRYTMDGTEARRAMMQSYAVAMGYRPLDKPAVLGEAWRQLYPQMVDLISYGGLERESYPCYQRVATEMERIAFGPSAINLGCMLSLMRAGLIWQRCGSPLYPNLEVKRPQLEVNAVIAGPTQLRSDGPLQRLLDAGMLQRCVNSGGIQVDRCGRPISADGDAIRGLAVFGRMTEGWVIGNDTLNRTLHPSMERWADALEPIQKGV